MKHSLSKVKQPKKFDFILLTILVLIFIGSLIAIYSSFPLLPGYLNGYTVLLKQIVFYILGFIIILSIMYVGNDHLYEFAVIGYKIVMGTLIYLILAKYLKSYIPFVFNFANDVNGAFSWLIFPVIGTIQPSEFMKIILIIITAYTIKDHNDNKQFDSFESDIELFIKVLKWAIPPMFLILIQPDTGICIIIAFSLALMIACSGIRKEWIYACVILVTAALGIFFYLFYYQPDLFADLFNVSTSYKMKRIYGWLQVEQRANGDGMQLYTALLALGSSGLTGHGIQSDAISLLEPHTDFIFAVIGLGFGFIGCLIVIGLCLALDLRLCIIALRSKNSIEKVMIIGFIGMLIFQQLQNIGMVCGLLPITGITLPLISAGGSSLLSYMIAFGIVMNASMKAKKLSDYVYQ